MFRSGSPFGNDTSSYVGSIMSNEFSTDEVASQVSNISRPSARSIYSQRQEYAASMNKMMSKMQFKVEHLFTCNLDGQELRGVADCVERLRLLHGMGRLWGQNMLLEVRSPHLLLTDRETKEELESIAFSDVQEIKAVLNSSVCDSMLILLVWPGKKSNGSVFMFQCEEIRADYVQKGLLQVLSRRQEDSDLGVKNLQNSVRPKEQKPAVIPEPKWTPNYEEEFEPQQLEEEEEEEEEEASPVRRDPPLLRPPSPEEDFQPLRPYTELDRSVDILNHILSDLEIFMGQVAAVVAKNQKKKKKKKKGKEMDGMPPAGEFAMCLHKIKYGFNMLGELNGQINNPSAADFVHSLFSVLAYVVTHCPEDLPPSIVAPLFTPQSIRLMSEEATAEEDQLWQSLGDAWNIPSTKWPEDDEDIPTYTLEFSDGWEPPEVREAPEPPEQPKPSVSPVSRPENHHRPATTQNPAKSTPLPSRPPSASKRPVEAKPRPMRVSTDFISRNHRELTVRKGEEVEVLDTSKQWWKVRNSSGEEGYVPNNALESEDRPQEPTGDGSVLTKKSRPADVRAWLEHMDFSKITVRCLGVLSGSMLLGMTREELKKLCPEEGGRVFYQLQVVKTALAGAS